MQTGGRQRSCVLNLHHSELQDTRYLFVLLLQPTQLLSQQLAISLPCPQPTACAMSHNPAHLSAVPARRAFHHLYAAPVSLCTPVALPPRIVPTISPNHCCGSRPNCPALRAASASHRSLSSVECNTELEDVDLLHMGEAAPSGSDPSEYLRQATALRRWVLSHAHCKSMPSMLQPRLLDTPAGCGMVTAEPLSRGQTLVQVPGQLFMTLDSALACPQYGNIIKEAGLNEWQALIMHLLCERARTTDSFWAPYLDMLPNQSHHPLLWGPEQLAWLEGSPLAATIADRQRQVEEDTEMLLVACANDTELARAWSVGNPEDLVTVRSVGWAAAILLSRAFSLDMSEVEPIEGDMSYFGSWQEHRPDVLALVPWADMLQHSSAAGPESCLRFNCEQGSATLVAHRSYVPGEEVFSSYGPTLSARELFLDHGFVDEANSNHKVDLPAATVVTARSNRNRALLGALQAMQGNANLVFTPEGPDSTTVTYVRAALASDAELVRAGWRVKASETDIELACRAMGSLSEPVSAASETLVLNALEAFVLRQIQAYPTSLTQDYALLEDALTPMPRKAALRAIISEKLSLEGSLECVREWKEALAADCPLTELYNWNSTGEGEDGNVAELDTQQEAGKELVQK